MQIEQKRIEEASVYIGEYAKPGYKMGEQRRQDVQRLLKLIAPGSLLDVGTGRGETLDFAQSLGYSALTGTETVPELLNERVVKAYSIGLPFPDKSYDVVTCFDVMEHLIEEDLIPSIQEFTRVARRNIIVSWADYVSSVWGGGRDLHISKRSAVEAEKLLKQAAPDWTITRQGEAGGSPAWILTR